MVCAPLRKDSKYIYDKDTGLYYINARYYDAETGRFISQDSHCGEIDDAGTWHLYAYCANDPINNIDPTGHLKKRRYNKVCTVAKFIDAVVIVVGEYLQRKH